MIQYVDETDPRVQQIYEWRRQIEAIYGIGSTVECVAPHVGDDGRIHAAFTLTKSEWFEPVILRFAL